MVFMFYCRKRIAIHVYNDITLYWIQYAILKVFAEGDDQYTDGNNHARNAENFKNKFYLIHACQRVYLGDNWNNDYSIRNEQEIPNDATKYNKCERRTITLVLDSVMYKARVIGVTKVCLLIQISRIRAVMK